MVEEENQSPLISVLMWIATVALLLTCAMCAGMVGKWW